jgi:hypothetical protein
LDETGMNEGMNEAKAFGSLPLLHLSTGISGAQTIEFTVYYLLPTG